MPFQTVRASLTVPADYAAEVHEIMETAIDQVAVRDIPVADSEVTDECADPPENSETHIARSSGTINN